MTEHQPGTVLPLSECKPGWLVRAEGGNPIVVDARHLAEGYSFRDYPVTLISTAPGWTPAGDGDPTKCKVAQSCWQDGTLTFRHGLGPHRNKYRGREVLFWRDASHDAPAQAPAQAPDLAARVAELERRLNACCLVGDMKDDIAESEVALAEFQRLGGKRLDQLATELSAPTFSTSRKPADPAPGVMGDDEMIFKAWKDGNTSKEVGEILLRLTRAGDRAAREARTEAAVEVFMSIWHDPNGNTVDGFRAALAAYEGEG